MEDFMNLTLEKLQAAHEELLKAKQGVDDENTALKGQLDNLATENQELEKENQELKTQAAKETPTTPEKPKEGPGFIEDKGQKFILIFKTRTGVSKEDAENEVLKHKSRYGLKDYRLKEVNPGRYAVYMAK